MKLIAIGLLSVSLIALSSCFSKSELNSVKMTSSLPEEGIQFFEGNWTKALEQARKENKLIFLDAYASWCGPCKQLKRKTFPDKAAGEFFNKNFINIAIDMEEGEGPALGAKYSVTAYPTLIIADADGKLVAYTKGLINPTQLIEFGNYGLSQGKN